MIEPPEDANEHNNRVMFERHNDPDLYDSPVLDAAAFDAVCEQYSSLVYGAESILYRTIQRYMVETNKKASA